METRPVEMNGITMNLGQEYKDKTTGSIGIATAAASYLTGCDQIKLEWNDLTGRPVEFWIDVTRIEDVEPEERPGGPQPNMTNFGLNK